MFTPGQVLYLVPIRFWETQEPETCRFIRDGGKSTDGSIRFVYAFHDGYGHNVYLKAKNVFTSCEEAVAEAMRRKTAQEAEEEAQLDSLMDQIFADIRAAKE